MAPRPVATLDHPPWLPMADLLPIFWKSFAVQATPHPRLGTPCWIWTREIGSEGYGQIRINHPSLGVRIVKAHRITLAITLVKWPTVDILACHHCDVPGCVAPLHIYAGTNASNAFDKAKRGRCKTGLKRGVQSQNRRVTDAEMQRALDLYYGPQGNGRNEYLARSGGHTVTSLAKQFNVLEIVIRHLVYGKTKRPRNLTAAQAEEVRSLYFSDRGQGSVCPSGTNVARWTVKSIAKELGISTSAVEHAALGTRFPKLRRPDWSYNYRGGYVSVASRDVPKDRHEEHH